MTEKVWKKETPAEKREEKARRGRPRDGKVGKTSRKSERQDDKEDRGKQRL